MDICNVCNPNSSVILHYTSHVWAPEPSNGTGMIELCALHFRLTNLNCVWLKTRDWGFFCFSLSLPLPLHHAAAAQRSMRLQVRTTSLQQRSADRPPGIWLHCLLFLEAPLGFFLRAISLQQVDKSSGLQQRKEVSPGVRYRESERIAKAGAADWGGRRLAFIFPRLQDFSEITRLKFRCAPVDLTKKYNLMEVVIRSGWKWVHCWVLARGEEGEKQVEDELGSQGTSTLSSRSLSSAEPCCNYQT